MTTPARPVAIVTGGRRGIGLGIAKALAADGFDIAITGIGGADAATDTMRADLAALGARAIYLTADLADLAGHAATVAALNGSPLWNLTPAFSLKVQAMPSAASSQLSARCG